MNISSECDKKGLHETIPKFKDCENKIKEFQNVATMAIKHQENPFDEALKIIDNIESYNVEAIQHHQELLKNLHELKQCCQQLCDVSTNNNLIMLYTIKFLLPIVILCWLISFFYIK